MHSPNGRIDSRKVLSHTIYTSNGMTNPRGYSAAHLTSHRHTRVSRAHLFLSHKDANRVLHQTLSDLNRLLARGGREHAELDVVTNLLEGEVDLLLETAAQHLITTQQTSTQNRTYVLHSLVQAHREWRGINTALSSSLIVLLPVPPCLGSYRWPSWLRAHDCGKVAHFRVQIRNLHNIWGL